MLTRITHRPITLPPHHALQGRQVLPQMHDLALDKQLGALGRRAQVLAIERARDVTGVPEGLAGAHADGERGAHVEDEGDGAPVQVVAGVAEAAGHAEGEGAACLVWVVWRDGCAEGCHVGA